MYPVAVLVSEIVGLIAPESKVSVEPTKCWCVVLGEHSQVPLQSE